jgi:tetratricopeptide (TPR) repeat protein
MPTKISRYSEGIMEAAWLAAVILVPVYFNIYSSRIFEPDKIAILRSLALLILGAWIVKLVNEGGVRWEHIKPEGSSVKFITKLPLIVPVIALAVLYIVSTIFSVTWRVSLLGSYQRLQGTYTSLSYLVIFVSMIANLRRRAQVERLITTIVLTSLPVALYGILQRYKIDPIPWGGDTSKRIASNMGNSIFVAAYLIMVFPLTIGRIVQSFGAILKDESYLWSQVARATVYVFTASVQLIAIYMSGSRGPALGLMAGAFFTFLLLSVYWHKRWLTLSIVAGSVLVSIFLIIFNIPNGPFDSLKTSPAIGRFGRLLDSESNSALVRKYIWQGAAELVSPHEPLEYPDGSIDSFNFLRPIIGYGPESMYVAYNPFYIPELAQVEKRNASPDRSHNETWDALVITGVLGIIVYLSLFTLIFYYGLKWLGLIDNKTQRNLYFGLFLVSGIIGAIVFSIWRGLEYIGVGLPFGMLIGLLLYLVLVSVPRSNKPSSNPNDAAQSLTLIMLIAAIVSHFVEINFGIAIAATRTYFWIYIALLLIVGYILPRSDQYKSSSVESVQSQNKLIKNNQKQSRSNRRKRRHGQMSRGLTLTDRLLNIREIMIPALIISIIFTTIGFNFVSNSQGLTSTLEVLWTSFTKLPDQGQATSYGVLMIFITTWMAMGVVMTSEWGQTENNVSTWWKKFTLTLMLSLGIGLFYWLWQAGGLAGLARYTPQSLEEVLVQVGNYESLLSQFYIFIFILIFVLGATLPEDWPVKVRVVTPLGAITAVMALMAVLSITLYTNLRVIQADIVFKLADPFTRNGQWPVALSIYQRANQLAPNEDFYYLFLGRAYLEHSKSLTDLEERDLFIDQSADDLRIAQSINPLNTDHTANLARLYSLWASYHNDPIISTEKAELSSNYFSRAVTLSPNNAKLWDEWALLYLNILQDPERAYELLLKAVEIDPEYHWTFALLGEYYSRQANDLSDQSDARIAYKRAAEYYENASALPTPGEPQAKYNYALALGRIYTNLNEFEKAVMIYSSAIELAPMNAEIWRIEEVIGSLNANMGNLPLALQHLYNALNSAPDGQKERLQSLINQLQQ